MIGGRGGRADRGGASLRLWLLNAYLRRFVKPHLARIVDADQLRAHLAASAGRLPKPPKAARFAPYPAVGAAPRCEVCAYDGADPSMRILYLHGGAYAAGAPETHRSVVWPLSQASGAVVVAPDYRLAPEDPFPAAVDDVVAAYLRLLDDGVAPGRIALAGDSAGGGLAFAATLALERLGAPAPAAIAAFSPYLDLSHSGESVRRNARRDAMLPAERLEEAAAAYLDGADPKNPLASPLFARFRAPPPTLIQVGASELLHDDAVRMAEALRAQRGDVRLETLRRTPHAVQFFAPHIREARDAVERAGRFLAERLRAASEASAA